MPGSGRAARVELLSISNWDVNDPVNTLIVQGRPATAEEVELFRTCGVDDWRAAIDLQRDVVEAMRAAAAAWTAELLASLQGGTSP